MYHRNNVAPVTFNRIEPPPPQVIQSTMSNIISMEQALQMNECKFFHSDDNNFYFVNCKMILQDSISLDHHDYDHGFFYQRSNNSAADYFVTCKLLSHPSIVNTLNREICGIDTGIDNLKQQESLSLNQKLNLERSLKQMLLSNFTQQERIGTDFNRNMNPFHGHNAANSQSNFDDAGDFSQQHNDFPPHHIPENGMRPDCEKQTVSTTDINNGFPGNNYVGHQDVVGVAHITHSLHQVDLNNFSQHHMTEIETRPDSRNTNSLYGTIQNNVMTTQVISMTEDINRNYNNNGLPCNIAHQGVDYTHPQQLNEFSPHRIPEREMTNELHGNIENNVMVTQAVSMTNINQNYNDNNLSYNDHQDVIGVESYTHNIPHPQQVHTLQHHTTVRQIRPEYNRSTNSFHENIGNNAMATQTVSVTDNQNYGMLHNSEVTHNATAGQ